jgi:hypothetical protein
MGSPVERIVSPMRKAMSRDSRNEAVMTRKQFRRGKRAVSDRGFMGFPPLKLWIFGEWGWFMRGCVRVVRIPK